MRFKPWRYLVGQVAIIVRGRAVERFMNLAVRRGVILWDVTRIAPDAIRARTRLGRLAALRHIARRTGSRLQFDERVGLPFWLARLRRRKGLVVGATFFFVALFTLGSFCWFVDVSGHERIPEARIREAARQAGLYPGVPRWRCDPTRVERALYEKVPGLAWIGVEVRGTRAHIKVVEKKLPAAEKSGPTNVVARKAGLVKEILVLSGQAAVRVGATVEPGQVLIAGRIDPPAPPAGTGQADTGKARPQVQPRYVRAMGMVRARVWYEAVGSAPLVEHKERLTGRRTQSIVIRVGTREMQVKGPAGSPYAHCRVESTTARVPGWRNLALPVEVIRTEYAEVEPYRLVRTPDEAVRLARAAALKEISGRLPAAAKILARRAEVLPSGKRRDVLRVRVIVETLEDIGTERPLKHKG